MKQTVQPIRSAAETDLRAPPSRRDLRLDFFRGLALIFIFIDHIPSNLLGWLTVRNIGFSDATEMFVFISGYSAAIAYGSARRRVGWLYASARILKRCWQIYIAHIFLFVIFTAEISYLTAKVSNPMFAEEMNITHFFNDPNISVIEGVLLKFRPVNMDVLPLYIVLLLMFAPVLWGLTVRPLLVLAASFLLYALASLYDINLPSYPPGRGWLFNPFAWQLLFVIGAFFGDQPQRMGWFLERRRFLMPAAWIFLVFALFVTLSWSIPALEELVPDGLERLMYPIDKTNLDPLRLVHFMTLAFVVVCMVPAHRAWLGSRWAEPIVRCGQHSLEIFCTSIFLSFGGYFILVQLDGSPPTQLAVSATGILTMIGAAYGLTWFSAADARSKRA